MNQGSLPIMGVRSFREAVRRLLDRVPRSGRADPTLLERAASEIRQFAEAHAGLFERAERLAAKAERLERAGTPSESARNRAERSRGEIEDLLSALRASFMASAGERAGRRAFDEELARRYPALGIPRGKL
jgi:hypothetical protein